jgi:hypothetical protein
MADWTKPMQQTYEYYIVDPNTWKDTERITTVKTSTINRDSETDTLGSAIFNITDSVGECYIRTYLVVVQNGLTERIPLGTHLVQTPSSSFDGKTRSVSMDAYTPLLELKEKQPPLGYYVPKTTYYKVTHEGTSYTATTEKIEAVMGTMMDGARTTTGKQVYRLITGETETYYCMDESIMDLVYRLTRENVRAPVARTESQVPLHYDFVSDTGDTWFSFLKDLVANANHEFILDELGRILFAPKQDTASLQPVWTYDDDNSSILYPELSMDHDLYMVPNVVEVVYSSGSDTLYARVENTDENSPTSIPNRGREIVHRVTNPDLVGIPTTDQVKEYAEQLLRNLSTIEYTITYSHGYCPVRVNDCVRLNYSRAGINNIKAKVISQQIKCDTGCKVTEKAVFTTKLWR